MSPQPLGHVFQDIDLAYNRNVLEQRPELAKLIAQLLAQWSIIEMYTGMVFVSLVGENADTTMIVYDSLTSAGAKDGSLSALARHKLSADDLQIFTATMKLVNKLSKERNAFAHGMIASRDELPDGVVVVDARDVTLSYYAYLVCDVDGRPASRTYSDASQRIMKKSRVYRADDLRKLVQQMEAAQQLMAGLVMFCRPGQQTTEARNAFLSVPEISKFVHQASSKRHG